MPIVLSALLSPTSRNWFFQDAPEISVPPYSHFLSFSENTVIISYLCLPSLFKSSPSCDIPGLRPF